MTRDPADTATTGRAQDLLTLARLSAGRGAVRAILDWLGRRTGGGPVLLVGVDGGILAESGPASSAGPASTSVATPVPAQRVPLVPDLRRIVSRAVPDLHRRGTTAAVLDGGDSCAVHLVTLRPTTWAGDRAPYLALASAADQQIGALLADAARTLGMCWWLAEAEGARLRIASADAHSREAVLHLLMVGDVPPARRIAAALRPRLPALLRVCVVECAGGRRHEAAAQIERAVPGRVWIVPCPVRANHLIALVPAGSPGGRRDGDPAGRLGRLIVAQVPGCRVGVSEQVALRDTASGYEQAFHALAVARVRPDGHSCFDRQSDLPPLTGADGYAWARALLSPCLSYVPARRADPGARELLGTLASWLAFDGAASRHLKIHRNTLAGRLRLINALLGLDLSRVRHQSAAWLALRLVGVPSSDQGTGETGSPPPPGSAGAQPREGTPGPQRPGPAGALDLLLATPAVQAWASAQLQPLRRAGQPALIDTVRTWLDADTSLAGTSAALAISLPATRKRLVRAERFLGRSLLRAPSARYELWLAMRTLGMVGD